MARARVLVVDDKENFLKLFSRILVDGYDLTTAGDGTRALSLIAAQEFDVVVTDIRMPGADGFEVLRAVKQRSPDTEVVMMTAYASVQSAVEAIKLGAYDYLQKPFDPDAAALVIGRALERKRLREQAASLRREIEGIYGFHSLVGKSARMREVYTLLEQASGLDITVLINGETGTGKELAARAVHYQSARARRSASCRSTAARCHRSWSRASCSATPAAPSPAPPAPSPGSSRRRRAARSSSTRSASCRFRSR
jgi:two-component system response regulator HydG